MGKKKVGETPVLEERVKQGVTEEEVAEFLKIIRKSEYTVVEQLHRMPAQISILGLLIASEVHRSALLKILNETHMPTDISMEKFLHLVGRRLILLPSPMTNFHRRVQVTIRHYICR